VHNHGLLQLWLKRPLDEAELYYTHIDHAFESPIKLGKRRTKALRINHTVQNNYRFHIGLSVLDGLRHALGVVGELEPNVGLQSVKRVGLSYDQVTSTEVAIGDVQNYLKVADFLHPNKRLLKNANRNNLLLITGVLIAKTEFSKLFNGKFELERDSEKKLVMSANDIGSFPIAVKVHRIDFDGGQFVNTTLMSDRRNLL
ncbi:MAG: hypothetical protein L7T85_00600, partial [Flavobacteriaceae bacterium]|nr:hypothetical protein [Flavobacteriaceae bacterium]